MMLNQVNIDQVQVSVDEGGTYEFVFGSYHIYAKEFDTGKFSRELLAGGYDFDVLQPMLNSAQEQYQALQETVPRGTPPPQRARPRLRPTPRPTMTPQTLPSWSELHPSRGFAAGLPAALRRHPHRRRRR